jgi:hypothetical protein
MSSRALLARFFGAVAVGVCSTSAFAATLVDYKPTPVSPTTPEFVFNGPAGSPSFQSGPGSIGNADGTAPVNAQTAGGLDAGVPFVIAGVPGSSVDAVAGTTDFFDSTLNLSGLAANAPALVAGTTFIQSLGSGGFQLLSTDPDGPGPLNPTLLLSGTISAASFIVGTGNAGATFNSFGVTYTGGAIYTAMLANGGSATGNSMSISMTDVTPNFSIDPSDGYLSNFSANATGLFNYTPAPEPSSIAAIGLLFGAAMKRRRAVRG